MHDLVVWLSQYAIDRPSKAKCNDSHSNEERGDSETKEWPIHMAFSIVSASTGFIVDRTTEITQPPGMIYHWQHTLSAACLHFLVRDFSST
jgi:hypothetical protein